MMPIAYPLPWKVVLKVIRVLVVDQEILKRY